MAALRELAIAWAEDETLPGDPTPQRLYQQLLFTLDGRHGTKMEIIRAPGIIGMYFPDYPPGFDATCIEFEFACAAIATKLSGPAYARQLAESIT